MKAFDWYRPELNRTTANAVLESAGVGRFIVRESQSQPGCYAISVWIGERMWHGVITPSTTQTGQVLYKLYVKNKFPSIVELVEHYKHHPVALNTKGHPVVLVVQQSDDE